MKNVIIFSICCISAFYTRAQDTIQWRNPSFEDIPKCCKVPFGWDDCGFTNESPPDIQPGFFSVSKKAYKGTTYIGLVTRDNGTYEAIGQYLKSPLKAGKTYRFRVTLYCADTLLSLSPKYTKIVNFNKPVYLKVWGAKLENKDAKLLFTSDTVIANREWYTYTVEFTPTETIQYILFEAAPYRVQSDSKRLAYNGNLMIDNLSPIIEIKN